MDRSVSLRHVLLVAAAALSAAAIALSAAACSNDSAASDASAGLAIDTVVGAGASFPYPLYSKWAEDFAEIGAMKLNYQSIGSGGGIEAVKAGTVDFGASDAPLEQAELEADGLVQFPLCVGGVVPVVNVEGVGDGQLKLTAELLAGIFSGAITTWDDKAITARNRGLDLPPTSISVVHRSDGSGTTWILTNYLTAAAPKQWTAGADKEISWPTGVGGTGNEGVAASVQQLNGSIGYVEYAYARQAQLTTVQVQNKAGAFVKPSLETFASAASRADWKGSLPSMYLVLVDQPGKETWPIAGASFILVHAEHEDVERATAMLTFFDWAYTSGGPTAESLDYVPIPKKVYSLVENEVWLDITISGTPIWQ
jgi:phosphate transport system substrate-binding protein